MTIGFNFSGQCFGSFSFYNPYPSEKQNYTGQIQIKIYFNPRFIYKYFFTTIVFPIYIIKHDIRIYVTDSRSNGWTEWADIFCGHSLVAIGCFRLKKNLTFFNFFKMFF